MHNRKNKRPSMKSMAISLLFTFSMIIAMNALPGLRSGDGTWETLRGIVLDGNFWRVQILPIAILYLLMIFVFPRVFEPLVLGRDARNHRLSLTRYRWLITIGGLVFIAGTAGSLASHLIRGTKSYSPDQLVFTSIFIVLYSSLIIYTWIRQPSAEWVEGFETGDHRRSLDERYQIVLGKASTTTLYWAMGLVLIAGSLYDILITKSWPARSITEVALIFVLWNVIYHRVDKAV